MEYKIIFLLMFALSLVVGTGNAMVYISNCTQLQQNLSGNLTGNFTLTGNIDCSDTINWNAGQGFAPIGGSFKGKLNGSGYVIKNLYINRSGSNDIALFNTLYGGHVSDLGLVNVNFSGVNDVAGIAGDLDDGGIIERCFVSGYLNGSGTEVGGLVGEFVLGTINNSFSNATVRGSGFHLGGLVGIIVAGIIDRSYAYGVVINGSTNAGGLIGTKTGGTVSNSFWNNETQVIDRSAAGTALTISGMNSTGNFTEANWVFPNTWFLDYYPVLNWQADLFAQTGEESSIEAQSEIFNLTITSNGTSNATFIYNGTKYGFDTKTTGQYLTFYKINFSIPEISNTSATKQWYWEFEVNKSSEKTAMNTTLTEIDILGVKYSLDNCSNNSLSTVIFDLYNETGWTNISGDETYLDVWFTSISVGNITETNYSVGMRNTVGQYKFCLNPEFENETFTVNAEIEYGDSIFSSRKWYLINSVLNNNSRVVNLYLLNNSDSQNLEITVLDQSGLPERDVYVTVQKLVLSEGGYRSVAMGQTDENGITNIVLQRGETVTYRFIITNSENTILHTTTPRVLTAADTTLSIEIDPADIFDYFGSVGINCFFSNTTMVFRCDVIDTSGLMENSRMVVERKVSLQYSTLCDTIYYTGSATHECTLPDNTSSYKYTIYVIANGRQTIQSTGSIDVYAAGQNQYGQMGLFAVMFLLIIMAFMGIQHPSVSIILQMTVIVMAHLLGWVASSMESAVIGLLFTGGIIIVLIGLKNR